MRHVVFVTEQELQRMHAQWERNFRLRLSCTEMQMVEVIRNRPVERGHRRVDQKMVMPGIGFYHPCRRNAHIDEAEPDDRRLRHIGSVDRINEVDLRIRGSRMPARRRRR